MIFRWIAELLVVVVVITILRSVIGVVMKILGGVFGGPQQAQGRGSSQTPPARPDVPMGGELKKDPVCGTFISTATAIQKRAGGEIYYFCSAECRDKFKG